ncbi:dienelactone hydrolase family protein [Trinickia dinghuensis]|uniref:Alpha/beta hydrolase n=1 Tax=Trinickia dinghuensis TaxID=2291023 RepID=A0A3D8K153_9BURK|nr:alpha/beta family hydrolase [Trinickia dinghuensis]RDU99163.1 alpha/beta hydrolase [Trinickia dinghuensis]
MQTQEVDIPADDVRLKGILTIPADAHAIVVFAHGSGSGRASPRNRQVADVLHEAGLATLLFDLLTEQEHQVDLVSAEYRFDIPLLANRLETALDWIYASPDTESLPVGLFGASTGAAAALIAASVLPDDVGAVVSRGGRADLAGDALPHVEAPTLLIVGELDEDVVHLNQLAASQLQCEHRIMIVADATHLFEEPGTLDHAARLACDWFLAKLMPVAG